MTAVRSCFTSRDSSPGTKLVRMRIGFRTPALRMAWRLYARAESDTSAHTGLLTSLRGLFCVRAMCLPNKLVYDIQSPQADGHIGCRVKDNSHPGLQASSHDARRTTLRFGSASPPLNYSIT